MKVVLANLICKIILRKRKLNGDKKPNTKNQFRSPTSRDWIQNHYIARGLNKKMLRKKNDKHKIAKWIEESTTIIGIE